MKNKLFLVTLFFVSSFSLSSCSVFLASEKQGASPDEVAQCQTRSCLINKGAILIKQIPNKKGVVTEEIMQVQKPSGSKARAGTNAALDVVTLGVWEVAGTPMEGIISRPNRYTIEVFYQANGEDIKSIKFIQPKRSK